MLELEYNGYYPLTKDHLDRYVPSDPGIFMLAVRLVNGVHQNFFTSQSDNLYHSLQKIYKGEWSHLSEVVQEHLEKYQCYFTFFVIFQHDHNNEIEKMLTRTSDPIANLTVVNCN